MNTPAPPVIRKHDAAPGSTRLEALGLVWLAEAMPDGGAPVVPVRCGEGWLEEPRLHQSRPTPAAARAFGRALGCIFPSFLRRKICSSESLISSITTTKINNANIINGT